MEEQPLEKVNLPEKFSLIKDHWNPRISGELNGQQVKLAKFLARLNGTTTRTRMSSFW
jgi:hypothetical protein